MYRKYLRLKGCPRCGGDLLIDREYEEHTEACIQCGYRNYADTVKKPVRRKSVRAPAVVGRKSVKQPA